MEEMPLITEELVECVLSEHFTPSQIESILDTNLFGFMNLSLRQYGQKYGWERVYAVAWGIVRACQNAGPVQKK